MTEVSRQTSAAQISHTRPEGHVERSGRSLERSSVSVTNTAHGEMAMMRPPRDHTQGFSSVIDRMSPKKELHSTMTFPLIKEQAFSPNVPEVSDKKFDGNLSGEAWRTVAKPKPTIAIFTIPSHTEQESVAKGRTSAVSAERKAHRHEEHMSRRNHLDNHFEKPQAGRNDKQLSSNKYIDSTLEVVKRPTTVLAEQNRQLTDTGQRWQPSADWRPRQVKQPESEVVISKHEHVPSAPGMPIRERKFSVQAVTVAEHQPMKQIAEVRDALAVITHAEPRRQQVSLAERQQEQVQRVMKLNELEERLKTVTEQRRGKAIIICCEDILLEKTTKQEILQAKIKLEEHMNSLPKSKTERRHEPSGRVADYIKDKITNMNRIRKVIDRYDSLTNGEDREVMAMDLVSDIPDYIQPESLRSRLPRIIRTNMPDLSLLFFKLQFFFAQKVNSKQEAIRVAERATEQFTAVTIGLNEASVSADYVRRFVTGEDADPGVLAQMSAAM